MTNTVLKRAYCDHVPTLYTYIIRVVQVLILAITYQLNIQWRVSIYLVVTQVIDKLIYWCKIQANCITTILCYGYILKRKASIYTKWRCTITWYHLPDIHIILMDYSSLNQQRSWDIRIFTCISGCTVLLLTLLSFVYAL